MDEDVVIEVICKPNGKKYVSLEHLKEYALLQALEFKNSPDVKDTWMNFYEQLSIMNRRI